MPKVIEDLKNYAKELGYEVVEHTYSIYFKTPSFSFVVQLDHNGNFKKAMKPNPFKADCTTYTSVNKLRAGLVRWSIHTE